MKVNVYSIFDTAAAVYMRPMFMAADGQAVRLFGDLCLDAESDLGKHPEDYALYRIGMYDDNKAQLVPEDRECLTTGLEVIAASRNVKRDNLEVLTEIQDNAQVSNGT